MAQELYWTKDEFGNTVQRTREVGTPGLNAPQATQAPTAPSVNKNPEIPQDPTKAGYGGPQAPIQDFQGVSVNAAGTYNPGDPNQRQLPGAEFRAQLTQEDILKREQEQNKAIYNNSLRDINKQYAQTSEALNKNNTQQQGLARVRQAQAGSLFTTTTGGYDDPTGIRDPYGPNTVLGEMQNQFNLTMQELERNRDGLLVAAQQAYNDGNLRAAREYQANYKAAQQEAIDNQLKFEAQKQAKLKGAIEYQKAIREAAQVDLSTMIQGGMEEQITPDYLRGLEYANSWEPGMGQALVNITKSEIERQNATDRAAAEKATFENAKAVADIMEKIPVGKSVTIGGSTYAGTKTSGVLSSGVETNSEGRATAYSVNNVTGEVTTQNLGYIGTSKDGFQLQFDGNGNPFNYNPRTGQLFYAGERQADYAQTIPEGEQGGQCGTFVRTMTGVADPKTGLFPNDLQGKIALTDKSIGSPDNPVQPGDVFVQAVGGWTGHTGIINSVVPIEGTDDAILTITESNWNKDERVSHTRQMKLSDPTLRGFTRPDPAKMNPALKIGTDSPTFAPKTPVDKLQTSVQEVNGRKVLINTQTGETVKDLGVATTGSGEKALSAEAAKTLENAQSGMRAIETIRKEVGGFNRLQQKIPGQFGAKILEAASQEAIDVIARLRTGAAISAEEEKRYRGYLPGLLDSPSTIEYKLNKLNDVFTGVANRMQVGTGTTTTLEPPNVDLGLLQTKYGY